MESTKAFLKSHCNFSVTIFYLKECNTKYAHYTKVVGGLVAVLFDVTKSSNAERSRDELTENCMIINVILITYAKACKFL